MDIDSDVCRKCGEDVADCGCSSQRLNSSAHKPTNLQKLLDMVPRDFHFCDSDYWKWESYAQGLIECIWGYTRWSWKTLEGDSWGPLVRGVSANNTKGEREEASYG